jgi:phosphate-selective porin OprO/OprP
MWLGLTMSVALARAQKEGRVGRSVYWEDGLHLIGPHENLELLWNVKIDGDVGNIDADRELQAAFNGLGDNHADLRRLNLALMGRWIGVLEYKLEVDFSDAQSIKDEWIRFTGNETLRHFIFGHMKEPFSLENLTSSTHTAFMERSLPTMAFSPGRNFGAVAVGNRGGALTWSFGYFLNTGSLSFDGQSKDQLSAGNGIDLAIRITDLVQYQDDGRRLTHLGFSWSHGFRDGDREDPNAQLRTRPESFLTDVRLVDTGNLVNHRRDLVAIEAAWVNGPLSFQGEYFHAFIESTENFDFGGWYLSGSYVLTGETREYRKTGGVFGEIKPVRSFHPSTGGWGALELALRYSSVDLNDKNVRGGKERNITVGLNWYLTRKIRFMGNYIYVNVKDRDEPPVSSGDANIFMARFQFSI